MEFKLSKQTIFVTSFPAFKNHKSNPYNQLLFSEVEKLDVKVQEFRLFSFVFEKADILHIHWPEFYLNSKYKAKAFFYSLMLILSIFVKKRMRTKIVWTVHNLEPHKIRYPLLSKLFWWFFLRQIDGICSLSHANETLALDLYPLLKRCLKVVTYHGLYKSPQSMNLLQRVAAREKLGIHADVDLFLCLGQIKSYKNYEGLINTFIALKDKAPVHLLIAGKADDSDYLASLRSLVESTDNVTLHAEFISEEDLALYYAAATYSIIPFDKIFNSGSMLLSVSMKTPVIIPTTPNFVEYQKFTRGYMMLYEGKFDESVIMNALQTKHEQKSLKVDKDLEWTNIAKGTAMLYERLLHPNMK